MISLLLLRKRSCHGFTMIELMVVLVILVFLFVIGLNYYATSQKDARDAKRVSDLRSLQMAVEDFSMQNGFFPGVGKCLNNPNPGWNFSNCQSGDWDRSTDDFSQILAPSILISTLPLDPLNIGDFPGFSYGYKAWPTGANATYYICANLENHMGSIQYGGYNYCVKGGCTICH